jgi:hypothetical protein
VSPCPPPRPARLVPEPSPAVRAAALQLAVSTLAPILGVLLLLLLVTAICCCCKRSGPH